jgi:hypothetical protein
MKNGNRSFMGEFKGGDGDMTDMNSHVTENHWGSNNSPNKEMAAMYNNKMPLGINDEIDKSDSKDRNGIDTTLQKHNGMQDL